MIEWLSIIGIGEDGFEGLSLASRKALAEAEVVFGGPRHLAMVEHPDKQPWPVPFSTAPVLERRGRPTAVLVSGDPFWHGAGGTLAAVLSREEWRAFTAPSVFSLAAARTGWRLEEVTAVGLHAAPLTRLRPDLVPGARIIATLRGGTAVHELAQWLANEGFGQTHITVMEHLGGPSEHIRADIAQNFAIEEIGALVTAALEVQGQGTVIPSALGIADDFFAHDGQITKRPVRALALSALAPRRGELLWDLGAGSGSIGIEWLLSHPSTRCIGVERHPARAARARDNARRLGMDRLDLREGAALDLIADLPDPDAVFVGGGANEALFEALWARLPEGARLVAHSVTLETDALLAEWQAAKGGTLMRVQISETREIGGKRGWKAGYPITQWSVTK